MASLWSRVSTNIPYPLPLIKTLLVYCMLLVTKLELALHHWLHNGFSLTPDAHTCVHHFMCLYMYQEKHFDDKKKKLKTRMGWSSPPTHLCLPSLYIYLRRTSWGVLSYLVRLSRKRTFSSLLSLNIIHVLPHCKEAGHEQVYHWLVHIATPPTMVTWSAWDVHKV